MSETYDSKWNCYVVDTDDGTSGDTIYEFVSEVDEKEESNEDKDGPLD